MVQEKGIVIEDIQMLDKLESDILDLLDNSELTHGSKYTILQSISYRVMKYGVLGEDDNENN